MHMHQQNHWNRVLFYWYQLYHWYQWTISLTNRIRLCILDMCENLLYRLLFAHYKKDQEILNVGFNQMFASYTGYGARRL